MKHYPQTFEQVFSIDKASSKTKLNLDQVAVGEMELNKYISIFQDFLGDAYNNLFSYVVKISWLRRKFSYYGKKTILPMNKNSLLSGLAFTKLLRRNVGKDLQVITKSKFFSKIESYLEELFPGFMDGDPFKTPGYYKFPYKNISMEYMIVVYQIKERLELLDEADKRKMPFAIFLDYVINYVYSENQRLGKDKYQVRHNIDRDLPFYIRDTDVPLRSHNRNSYKKQWNLNL